VVLWLVEVEAEVEEEVIESMGLRALFAWVLDGEGLLTVCGCLLAVEGL